MERFNHLPIFVTSQEAEENLAIDRRRSIRKETVTLNRTDTREISAIRTSEFREQENWAPIVDLQPFTCVPRSSGVAPQKLMGVSSVAAPQKKALHPAPKLESEDDNHALLINGGTPWRSLR